MEVFVNNLRPYSAFSCEKREEALEGVIISEYLGWQDGCFVVKHKDGAKGIYFADELEVSSMLTWYIVRKMYSYD